MHIGGGWWTKKGSLWGKWSYDVVSNAYGKLLGIFCGESFPNSLDLRQLIVYVSSFDMMYGVGITY